MNKFFHILPLFFLAVNCAFTQDYFQQEVNYTIQVSLNDKNHTLSAFERFEYVNNSPQTLDFLYIHLWPNAYRSQTSALGRQKYGSEYDMFGEKKETMSGGIDSLDFKVNGQNVKWEYDPHHEDICKLYLNQPLPSGGRIEVTTPFKVKIPSGSISRLGHIGQSYQITQWYPKPAVFDKSGWHQMPYLNQGEFYSEYGSFDVSITLPKNYVVGATGDLQTPSEVDFMNKLAETTEQKYKNGEMATKAFVRDSTKSKFPESSAEWKTIRYTQSRVHDFAWFADKRYHVLKGEVELPHSNRKVDTWSLFTWNNSFLWKKAPEYIRDGAYYYSLWNGDYPYNQITAVDGTISAGGGMEYPNVTVIGNASSAMELEIVIVHEVGHNWFYGILGSNERVHGWMDEGMNTLNEMRYVQTKYPNNKEFSDMVGGGMFHLNDLNHHDSGDFAYRMIAILGEDQRIETHSAKFTSMNYGFIMYQKTGLVFHYLKEVLGEEQFNKASRDYFENWKFKHPQPEDMRASMEKSTGQNLSWLFDDLIKNSNHIDYKIKRVKVKGDSVEIVLKNRGQVAGPVQLQMYDPVLNTPVSVTTEPFKRKLKFMVGGPAPYRVVIDENKQIPEMNRSNNIWEKKQLFNRIEPLKYEFLIGDQERNKTNRFWLPVFGGNNSDGFMLGLAVHNFGIPFKPYQFLVAPMYSFRNKHLTGIAEYNYTFLPRNNIKLVRLGLSVKSFGMDDLELINFGFNSAPVPKRNDYYVGISPYLYMKLGDRGPSTRYNHNLLLQTIYKYNNDVIDQTGNVGLMSENFTGGFVKYRYEYEFRRFKWDMTARADYMYQLEKEQSMLRASFENTMRFKYLNGKKEHWIDLRTFAGAMLIDDLADIRTRMNLSGINGEQDIFLEDYFFSRYANTSMSNQRYDNMGAMKNTVDVGLSANWMASANLYMQLPVKPNMFGAYADFGAFANDQATYGVFTTGLAIRVGRVLGLYFPVMNSKNLEQLYFSKNYLDRIRFHLRLNLVNQPLRLKNLF